MNFYSVQHRQFIEFRLRTLIEQRNVWRDLQVGPFYEEDAEYRSKIDQMVHDRGVKLYKLWFSLHPNLRKYWSANDYSSNGSKFVIN